VVYGTFSPTDAPPAGELVRSALKASESRRLKLRVRHPFLRRLAWNPLVVGVLFVYMWCTAYFAEFPLWRTAGTAFIGFWFGLSAHDTVSGHRWLDWLYSDEAEPPGDEES
jgi:hypothetical protein